MPLMNAGMMHATLVVGALLALASPSSPNCATPRGLAPLLEAGRVLLFGEMHGTVESPQFVAEVACAAIAARLTVAVGLEIPREEAASLNAFLASARSDHDRARLVRTPFWSDAYQDGRRSLAMMNLLSTIGELRSSAQIQVMPIDSASAKSAQERDHAMADAVVRMADEHPDAVVIVLTGNYHTRVTADSSFEPMGKAIRRLRPHRKTIALDVAYDGGSAWTCTTADPGSCGERTLRGRHAQALRGIALNPSIADGFDGVYDVGRLTASRPARR
jgi:hypothetical protein